MYPLIYLSKLTLSIGFTFTSATDLIDISNPEVSPFLGAFKLQNEPSASATSNNHLFLLLYTVAAIRFSFLISHNS